MTATNIEPQRRGVTLSDVDDAEQLRAEIAVLDADALDKVLAAILDRLIAETADADAMLSDQLQQIQTALRPITGTAVRDDGDGRRRQMLWHRLDAIVDLREVLRARLRQHAIENRPPDFQINEAPL
jgi:hypothetical protein